MSRTELKNKNYSKELAAFIRSGLSKEELRKRLSNYHENDIADALERLTAAERKRLYQILGVQRIAEILSYVDDPEIYFKELTIANAAKVISLMDSDDAVDVLENLEEDRKREIVKRLETISNIITAKSKRCASVLGRLSCIFNQGEIKGDIGYIVCLGVEIQFPTAN